MKKIALAIALLSILIIITTTSVIASKDTSMPAIKHEVTETLASKEKVSVIVTLKDKPVYQYGIIKTADAGSNKARQKNQEDVLKKLEKDEFKLSYQYNIINGFSGELTKEGLEKLASNPVVKKIDYDWPVHIALDNSIPQIDANSVWNEQIGGVNVTGTGQTVCIVDTGVDYNHSSLGADCYGSNDCVVIGGYDYVNSDAYPDDDHGHGTHCAGIVTSNDSTYTGVALDAKIVALKVLNSAGGGTSANVVRGIEWCVNNASTYNITIISLSLTLVDGSNNELIYTSACDGSDTVVDAANAAGAAGIFVAAAAGNDGDITGIGSPACGSNVTAVGGVTDADAMVYNRGPLLNIVAPGQTIKSLKAGGTTTPSGCSDTSVYRTCSGTSMAAPHVAATAALLFHECELLGITCTRTELYSALNTTGTTITDSGVGKSNSTYSRINVSAAYDNFAPPEITIEFPTEGATYNYNIIWANITVDRALSLANASIDGAANITMTNDTARHYYLNSTNINISTDGEHNISYYINSSSGDDNETEVFFTIDKTAPATVTGLANQSAGVSWIFWNWTEPDNSDFNHTELWLNDTYDHNIPNNTNGNSNDENITCLNASTIYMLSTRTVDTISNTNTSWVNDTASTASDSSSPSLTVSVPSSGTSYSTSTITYSISLTDPSQISWCGVSADRGSNTSLGFSNNACNGTTSLYTATATGTSETLTDGTHNATFYCNDSAGNMVASSSTSFTIDTSSGGSGGGASGGGTSSPPTVTYGKQLALSSNEKATLTVSGTSHTVTVTNITSDFATIKITSNPVTFTLRVGESRSVDVTGDAVDDIKVALNKIQTSKAYITITEITNVQIPEKEPSDSNETGVSAAEEKLKRRSFTYFLIALAIIACVVLAAVIALTLTRAPQVR